ncbi:MAG: zinc-dependent peptidase [Verrucomicrobiales bacterium]|nr:zinc-dependent peptidase [Verrucomicrobiales bacterium]
MEPFVTTFLSLGLVLLLGIWYSSRKARRRRHLMNSPLPEEWETVIRKDFPRYNELPSDLRNQLGGIARILAEEKNFEACGGFPEITERVKALVCLQAALLLVKLPKHKFYPRLQSILIYPGAFRDLGRRRFGVSEEADDGSMLGQSWNSGSVILSWDSVVAGAKNDDDGMNVAIHEFAHQLDQVNGAADGVPILRSRDAYRQWAEVFERNYEELVEEVNDRRRGREPLIDPYGATNPAEFFAVASETFYEEAQDLKKAHPDLYEQLQDYYGVDPASWG